MSVRRNKSESKARHTKTRHNRNKYNKRNESETNTDETEMLKTASKTKLGRKPKAGNTSTPQTRDVKNIKTTRTTNEMQRRYPQKTETQIGKSEDTYTSSEKR